MAATVSFIDLAGLSFNPVLISAVLEPSNLHIPILSLA